MEKQTFKRRLIDFFERHDSANLGLVEPIAEQFQGNEEAVFSTLNKFYTGKKSGVSRELIETELNMNSPILGNNTGSQVQNNTF